MLKRKIKLVSLLLVAVLGAAFLTAVSPERNSGTSVQAKTLTVQTVQEEKTPKTQQASAFSQEWLDMDYAMEDFKNSGFKDSDLRDVSSLQVAKTLKGENTKQAKEYIFDRMLNTMDFYKTLKGSYLHEEYWSDSVFTVDYALVNGENPESFEKIVYKGEEKQTESVYKNGVVTRVAVNDKAKTSPSIIDSYCLNAKEDHENDTIAIVKSTSRRQIDQEGIPVWYYRMETNGLSIARECVSPQEMTLGFLNDFSLWKIEKQEEYLGRSCFVISGSLSGDYGAKLKTSKYKLWVDAETGVLLKSRRWNSNGELVDAITTTSFSADDEVDKSLFSPLWLEDVNK